MLYLNKTSDAQRVFIPRGIVPPSGGLVLRLRSTVELDTVLDAVVLDVMTSPQYYAIAVALPEDTAVGEYHYHLATESGVELACGLAQVGEYDRPAAVQYDKPIYYEQYKQD